MSDEELRSLLSRRIDCPVPWCAGRWVDHGGEGQPPERWVHQDDDGFALPHGATLARDQEGAGPVTWSLYVEWDGTTSAVRNDTDLRRIAQVLRDLAASVEDVAALQEPYSPL